MLVQASTPKGGEITLCCTFSIQPVQTFSLCLHNSAAVIHIPSVASPTDIVIVSLEFLIVNSFWYFSDSLFDLTNFIIAKYDYFVRFKLIFFARTAVSMPSSIFAAFAFSSSFIL